MTPTALTSPRYRVLETIGKGGMGEVCLADDLMLERRVAVKFLISPDGESRPLEQLLAEARAAASLDHPFICKIFEVTELEGRPCIVMEYVSGDTLERRLRRGRLEVAELLRLAEEIAEALEAAHKRRLIHRDLKPANVMVTDDGHIKVMDFGLAARLSPVFEGADGDAAIATTAADISTCVGTPAYMAPEQLRGAAVDHRSDIFAFGVLLYELLSGTNPFQRLALNATLDAILAHDPPDLHEQVAAVPKSVAAVVSRMLAKHPAARFQSFGDVRLELRRSSGAMALPAADAHVPVIEPPAIGGQLVGRESEFAELVRSIRQALAGRGGLLLIEGESGVGKSRLVEEALTAARALGCLTLVGRCSEQEGTAPLEPYIEVLEDAARLLPASAFGDVVGRTAPELARLAPEFHRLFPDMPPAIELPPELRQRFLFNNVREFLTRCCAVMPVTVFLDDLQWADESTLQLTLYLAQHLDKTAILVIGAYRDVDVAREGTLADTLESLLSRVRGQQRRTASERHPLARVVDQLIGRRLARVISLEPFSEPAVGSMLAALGHRDPPAKLVHTFFDETGGNPFFVEELFHHLTDEGRLFDSQGRWRRDFEMDRIEVPAGIRTVIGWRLRRVSSRTYEVLTAAAVIGRHFDLDLLEMVVDVEGDRLTAALEEAEQAHLVKGPSGRTERRWRFVHQLVCHTLTSALPQTRRERLHHRVADAMMWLDSDSRAYASDIARHLYHAGRMSNPATTAEALMAAGNAAADVYASDEALRNYSHALEVLEESNGAAQDRLRMRERLADVLALTGDRGAAMEHYSAAVSVHERALSHVDQGRVLRKIGALHWQGGDRKQASEYYARALTALNGEADRIELAHLYQELGLAAFRGGDNQQAIQWADRALRSAETALADDATITTNRRRTAAAAVAHAMNTIGVALVRSGQVDAARQRIEDSVAVANQHGLLDVACRGYANLGVLYGMIEPKRAIQVSQTGLELASKIGAASLESYFYANLAAAYCVLTDDCKTDGLHAAQTAVDLDRELGQFDHLAVPLIVMAQIHQCQGQLQQAHDAYREALALAEKAGEPQLLFPCYDGLATICLDRGDRNRAEEFMEKGREVCARAGIDPDTLLVLPFLC
jgi:adenylate cyclase